ncbi:MAG: hypothetical protein JWP97_1969, partial [Labilithrix sp.]|nr:hypothetical protein [Labilithrix sp.]
PASASAAPASTAPSEQGTPSKAPAPPVTLTPGAASPDPTAPLPVVRITSPARDQVLDAKTAGDFAVRLDVKGWQTSKGSSHVHLILDNKPYKPIYDTKDATKLSDLLAGDAPAEGLHVLVAFPSRANHESVKTKDALAIVPFWIGKKTAGAADPTKKPMLIYSRPKGEYNGEMANHVLVDFQVANVTLAEGKEHVHVTVTGPGVDKPIEGSVEKFGTPLYLDNLQNGSYQLKVELLDSANKLIEGPWNSTTRTIKVDHDAPMDPSMVMTPAGGADAGAGDAGKAAAGKDAGAKK